jgi:hypothetical protein
VAHQANATSRAIAPGGDPSTLAAEGREPACRLRQGARGSRPGWTTCRGSTSAQAAPPRVLPARGGWTQSRAAERFNALVARQGTDPQARAGMTGPRLCEVEKWPDSSRKPSVYMLLTLAGMYQTDVLRLLDLANHESLAPEDRLALLRSQPRASSATSTRPAATPTTPRVTRP